MSLKKAKEERTKKAVIIVLILFSFIIGFLIGAIAGANSVINNLVDFIDGSGVDIDINLNETKMVDYMMEKVQEIQKAEFGEPGMPMVDVRERESQLLQYPEVNP